MDVKKYDFMDTTKYDFSMEIFYDAKDLIRWRIVREDKTSKEREIEVSGRCTFETVDDAQAHCCFFLGDKWGVTEVK